ncbi:hypothetical protein [Paenibacillus sp. GbtcB18]|uniref:hypothetical protein n=1 Tax=Paenibacillus sp. GbtcB18 TaxID=2824763 RepID=UPI001C306E20|nr:hypothetical protein [Paenibacillus sp. GbtcB18]
MFTKSPMFILLKMFLICFIFFYLRNWYAGNEGTLSNDALEAAGYVIIFFIVFTIASVIPPGSKTNPLLLADDIGDEVSKFLSRYSVLEGKRGLYRNATITEDGTTKYIYQPIDNPEEFVYTLYNYKRILQTCDSPKTNRILYHLEKQIEEVDYMRHNTVFPVYNDLLNNLNQKSTQHDK